MQQPVSSIPARRDKFRAIPIAVPIAAILAFFTPLTGCEPPPLPPEGGKPFAGQALTLRCADAAFADAITPAVRAWEYRTGAKVSVVREAMASGDDTDVGILPAGDLGEWAEAGLLAPVPAKLRASDNPFRWFELLSAYGDHLVGWGGQVVAVPLTGDGCVIAYRADLFKEKGRNPPSTWGEFADAAAFFAGQDKKPSLPPMPADPGRAFDLFSRVAASMDRRALSDVELAAQAAKGRDSAAFYFTISPNQNPAVAPRLDTFGFREAANFFDRLRAAKAVAPPGGSDDPVAALAEGRAVMALLSLDQLARLPKNGGAVEPRFALANVPSSRTYFNATAGQEMRDGPAANYVPYFAGGRVGVVRSQSKHPEAAFDLLAELGGPARGAEYVATPGLGAGPTRVTHLERERLILWLGYGFDEERTRTLQDAMRHFVGQSVKNPAYGLRGPDRAALVSAATEPILKIGGGLKPGEAVAQADAAWNALRDKAPEKFLAFRRHAAGMN